MQNKQVSISAIVVSFNCADVIFECINSLLHHQDCEVILVDNNSTDATVKNLEPILNKIKFIPNTVNMGFTKACNQAIDVASGEYLLLFNPDAYVTDTTTLNLLVNELNNNPKLGAVAPQLLYPDGKLQNYNRRFPFISGVIVESFVPSKFWNKFSSYKKYTYQDLDLSKENYLEQPAGAAILFRREFRLDENYFIYGSDVELCKNIIDAGLKIKTVPASQVFHHQSKGGTENVNHLIKMYLQLEYYFAMRYFFSKHYGVLYATFYIIINSIFLFIVAAISILSFNQNKINLKFKRLLYFLQSKRLSNGGKLSA
jgi:hypothetical protein